MAIQIGGTTVIDNSRNVIAGLGASMTVGSGAFVTGSSIGLGYTDTTGRDAGVGTATGTLIYNESDYAVQVWDGTQWINGLTSPFSATGGTKDTTSRSGYAVHTFTSPGSFVVSGAPNTGGEYLVIAGGGCGGILGGGGAGGYRTATSFTLNAGTYTIQVGGGGAPGRPSVPSGTQVGSDGTPSFITNPGITSITATGGGGGGGTDSVPRDGWPGGSGGGSGFNSLAPGSGGSGNTPPVSPPQGNDGGTGNSSTPSDAAGGGGGGAGSAGSSSPNGYTGAAGGNGASSSITGTAVTRAGGGGGGGYRLNNPSVGGAAGPGGGGAGGYGIGPSGSPGPLPPSSKSPSTAGTVNTGGGGGGNGLDPNGWGTDPTISGSSGGSGIVIIAYPTS